MTPFQGALRDALSAFPEANAKELASVILNQIVRDLDDMATGALRKVSLPSVAELKRQELQQKRVKQKYRMSWEEMSRKTEFVNLLSLIKLREEKSALDSGHTFVHDGFKMSNSLHFPNPPSSHADRGMLKVSSSRDFLRTMEQIDETGSEHVEKMVSTSPESVIESRKLEQKIEEVERIAGEIVGDNLKEIKRVHDDDLGFAIEVKVNQTDSEAFDTWFSILKRRDATGTTIPVVVTWTGGSVLSEKDFVHKAVEVMIRSGLGPKRSDRFDSVSELEEEWG